MVAGLGFEPRLADPNSTVLPLDDPAMTVCEQHLLINIITRLSKNKKKGICPHTGRYTLPARIKTNLYLDTLISSPTGRLSASQALMVIMPFAFTVTL